MAIIGTDIDFAADLLKSGKLVAIPTETVYGLAANAFDETAVLNIFKAKNRPQFDPLIAHVPDIESVRKITIHVPSILEDIMSDIWPGPLTVLLPKSNLIPDLVTSGLDRVAVRLPRHPITANLLKQLDFPLAAPSANPFGYVSPTTAQHVNEQLGEKVDYILDGGPSDVGIESTIIGLELDQLTVYRLGGTSIEQLEKYGPVRVQLNQSSNPQAPGMLKSHYAPSKPLYIGDIYELAENHKDKRIGIISLKGIDLPDINQYILSQAGNLDEAAHHVFAALRVMDQSDIEIVLAEWMPDVGLGRAINDRLRRAAAR